MSDTIHFSVIYVPSDLSEQCLSNRDNSPECPLKSEQQLVKSENSGTEDAELTAYKAETWQMKLNIWVVCWIVFISFWKTTSSRWPFQPDVDTPKSGNDFPTRKMGPNDKHLNAASNTKRDWCGTHHQAAVEDIKVAVSSNHLQHTHTHILIHLMIWCGHPELSGEF